MIDIGEGVPSGLPCAEQELRSANERLASRYGLYLTAHNQLHPYPDQTSTGNRHDRESYFSFPFREFLCSSGGIMVSPNR